MVPVVDLVAISMLAPCSSLTFFIAPPPSLSGRPSRTQRTTCPRPSREPEPSECRCRPPLTSTSPPPRPAPSRPPRALADSSFSLISCRASKEANKSVAKDSNAGIGTRVSAGMDALGDKVRFRSSRRSPLDHHISSRRSPLDHHVSPSTDNAPTLYLFLPGRPARTRG